jgi:hypothetical protein
LNGSEHQFATTDRGRARGRVCGTRQLPSQFDDDPVVALSLDRRFLDSVLVDAPANDLDRAVDRIGGTRIQSGRTEAQRDFIVVADGKFLASREDERCPSSWQWETGFDPAATL